MVEPRMFAGPTFGGGLFGFKVRFVEFHTFTMSPYILRLPGHLALA